MTLILVICILETYSYICITEKVNSETCISEAHISKGTYLKKYITKTCLLETDISETRILGPVRLTIVLNKVNVLIRRRHNLFKLEIRVYEIRQAPKMMTVENHLC